MEIYIDDKLDIQFLSYPPLNFEISENCSDDEKEKIFKEIFEIGKSALNLRKPFSMFDYVKEAFNLNISENYTVEQDQNNKIKTPLLQLQVKCFSNNSNEFKFLKEMQCEGIPYDDENNERDDRKDSEQVRNKRSAELKELTEKEFWVYQPPHSYNTHGHHVPRCFSAIEILCSYLNENSPIYNNNKIVDCFTSSKSCAFKAFEGNEEYTIDNYFNDLGIKNNTDIAEQISNNTDFNCFYILLSNNKLRKILFENINVNDPESTFHTFKRLNDFSWKAYKENLTFPGINREIEWAKINAFISNCKFPNSLLRAYSINCDYGEISKFTYFCVLYLKVRDHLDFVKCEGCGKQKPIKPSSYDRKNDYYCENCKSSAEFKEMKSKMNKDRKKFEKAKRCFRDMVKEDDPMTYEENLAEISFYENLIIRLHDQTDKYLKEDFKVTVGKTMPDDNTNYNEKYNDLTEIYEKYFTAVNFFKIITADLKKVTKKEINSWEITVFDEAIKRLRESHDIDLKDFENFEKIYAEYEENWKNQKKVPVEKFLYDPKNYLIPEQREQPFD